MEIIIILIVVALFSVFLLLSFKNKLKVKPQQKQVSTPASQPQQQPKQEEKTKPHKNTCVQLTSRPDFSDMLPEKKSTQRKYADPNKLKTLTASQGLEAKTDLYDRKTTNTKNKKLAEELKHLSPEIKTILFGNVLDKKE